MGKINLRVVIGIILRSTEHTKWELLRKYTALKIVRRKNHGAAWSYRGSAGTY
jgi:hypothetical protein